MLWAFKPCPLEINSDGRLKREHLESSSSALKALDFHNHHNAYGQKIWNRDDLTWGISIQKWDMTFWSRGLLKSCDKRKPLYPYYQSAYDHQTWQDGNLDGLLLDDYLITSSFEITWQTKTIIFAQELCLWSPNLAGWWPTLTGSYP